MIYLHAPFYSDKSNGIVVTYELLRILNRNGMETKLLCYENERYDIELPDDLKPYYVSKALLPKDITSDDDVVIYLDTATGNVYNAKNVIYWLLNKPIALTGESIDFQQEDILVAYSTLVHDKLPQLFILKDEREVFSCLRQSVQRSDEVVSLYFGKVNKKKLLASNEKLRDILKKYKKVNIITRQSPPSHEKMLELIAQSDLLISYDPLSNTNYEATLLGTPVLMMDDAYGLEKTAFNVGNYGLAFKAEDVENARESVGHAFQTYCHWLENQEAYVLASFRKILEKVSQVKADPQLLQLNMMTTEKAKADFKAFFETLKEPFKNIDFPFSIPSATKKVVGSLSRSTNGIGMAERTLKDKLKNVLRAIKPAWINNAYRKVPGDLKLYELCFFIFRRMIVCWRK